ncbi:hypothetical protein CRUP_007315 [Coryphaenoides rupestris]|nr:hypothetical protein CRUP_007315 [Coryphaenoides rupestris]
MLTGRRQNHLTQNPKRSANTGQRRDRSGTKDGYYMYIEASRPRAPGDKARLLSPLFNVTSVRGPKGSGRVPYCVAFYYHMKGKHIGLRRRAHRVASAGSFTPHRSPPLPPSCDPTLRLLPPPPPPLPHPAAPPSSSSTLRLLLLGTRPPRPCLMARRGGGGARGRPWTSRAHQGGVQRLQSP